MKWFVMVVGVVSNPSFSQQGVCRWQKELYCVNTGCHNIWNIMNASFIVSLSYGDPFVLKSNQSGHPSSMSGDSILRSCCTRWIEREILKLRRLLITFAGKWCLAPLAKTKKIRNFSGSIFTNNNLIIIILERILADQWISSSVKYLK